MKKIFFISIFTLIVLVVFLKNMRTELPVYDIVGEWYYENGVDRKTKDSVHYENTIIRFSENGMYEYLKKGEWILDSLTHWKVKNNLFYMGDGTAGTIVNGVIVQEDNAKWQAKIVHQDTIKGWFEVYHRPLKTEFLMIRKK